VTREEITMRKVTVALLVVAMLVVLVVPASAKQSIPVSGGLVGSGRVPGPPPTFTEAGKTCFVEGDFWYEWGGDIAGLSTHHARIVSHGPCYLEDSGIPYPKGSFRENLMMRGTFDGTVAGREGAFEYILVLEFAPVAGGPAERPNFDIEGRLVVLDGMGGLAGLHGVVRMEGGQRDGVPSLGYEGEIHFDPQ
jgi:hypothetical protein